MDDNSLLDSLDTSVSPDSSSPSDGSGNVFGSALSSLGSLGSNALSVYQAVAGKPGPTVANKPAVAAALPSSSMLIVGVLAMVVFGAFLFLKKK